MSFNWNFISSAYALLCSCSSRVRLAFHESFVCVQLLCIQHPFGHNMNINALHSNIFSVRSHTLRLVYYVLLWTRWIFEKKTFKYKIPLHRKFNWSIFTRQKYFILFIRVFCVCDLCVLSFRSYIYTDVHIQSVLNNNNDEYDRLGVDGRERIDHFIEERKLIFLLDENARAESNCLFLSVE